MSTVSVLLLNSEKMRDFYFTKDVAKTASQMIAHGEYQLLNTMVISQEGKKAAEEMFDLSNNPGREDEREIHYGRHRSVSVGDIVVVDGVNYVCARFGWEKLI